MVIVCCIYELIIQESFSTFHKLLLNKQGDKIIWGLLSTLPLSKYPDLAIPRTVFPPSYHEH